MKKMMGTLAIVLITGCATLTSAQTVTQGDVKTVTANEFHSPMIVETIFAPADRSLWKDEEWTPVKPRPWKGGDFTTAEYYDLGKYSVDGIFFHGGSNRNGTWNSGLLMNVKSITPKETTISVEAHFANPGTVQDKLVTLLLEVVNGDEMVGKGTLRIKVKQNWRRNEEDNGGRLKLALPTSSLTKDTRLRLTVTTRDY